MPHLPDVSGLRAGGNFGLPRSWPFPTISGVLTRAFSHPADRSEEGVPEAVERVHGARQGPVLPCHDAAEPAQENVRAQSPREVPRAAGNRYPPPQATLCFVLPGPSSSPPASPCLHDTKGRTVLSSPTSRLLSLGTGRGLRNPEAANVSRWCIFPHRKCFVAFCVASTRSLRG